MHLYLIRHGEAKSESEDPEQGLTENGISAVRKLGVFIEDHVFINLKVIYHSPKKRALETARFLSDYIEPSLGLEESADLVPMADPDIWAREIENHSENIMLVGHLPHLEELAIRLTACERTRDLIDFQTSSIVCLQRKDEENTWSIRWMIPPEVLK